MDNKVNPKRQKRLSPQEIYIYCGQIADLLEAGIPLADGLDAALDDFAGGDRLLEQLRDRMEEQVPLSRAMEESGVFPPYAVRMTEAGEQTGQSDVVMRELAEYYQQEAELRAVLRNAVAYPLTMTAIMLAVLFLLSFWVMPVFESVFLQLGAAFSPMTRAVVNGAAAVSGVGLVLIALIGVSFAVVWLTGSSERIMRMPVWNKTMGKSSVFLRIGESRFSRTVALALRSGMDFDKGIEMALTIVNNGVVEQKIDVCRGELDDGKSFYESVRKAGLFTAIQRQRLSIGIRSGKFDETMSEIAESCATEAAERAGRLVARLEPVLTAMMSVIAGGILVLVMLPLLGILSSIG